MDGQSPQTVEAQCEPKKVRHAGQFKPNDPRLRQNLEKAGPPEAVPEPADEVQDGASLLLKAMRWAVRNAGSKCKGTPIEVSQRKAYEKNPVKFLEVLTRQEQLFAQSRKGAEGKKGPAASRDQGHERVRELIDQLLDRWAKEAGGGSDH